MARRTKKLTAPDRPLSIWVFLLAGCGIGALLIASGVLVRVHGGGYQQTSTGVATGNVSAMGYTLMAVGLVAIGLTVALAVAKRRAATPKSKGRKRSR